MMTFIRWFLGKLILTWDATFRPQPLERSPEQQKRLDEMTRNLALYQYEACPFCVKVRRAIRRLNLQIELRDARGNPQYRAELEREGGQQQVPCLRIEEGGKARWLYESSDIIEYLEKLAQA